MAKVAFRSLYNKGDKSYKAPTGARTEMRHRAVMHENGRRELVRDKEVAIYELIQASREDCEIERIVKRAIEGDYNALNAMQGNYCDITGMPSSIAEAQQMVIDMKQKFDELPKDIKAKFEYNPELYVAEFGSEEWAEKVGYKDALENENRRIENQKIFNQNMEKAMANLAQGTTITQEGEVNE